MAGGFKLDDAFPISCPFFSGGLIVNDFLVAMGFSDSGPRLDFVGGSEMSVFVEVEWPEMIFVGRIKVGKMIACRLSIARAGGFLGFF